MRPRTDSLLDTIAALATPLGRSALALVRASGRDSRAIARRVARELPEDAAPRHAYLVFFRDGKGEVIDQGLATLFSAPASATGEDMAELSLHGSPIVARRLLAALFEAGARAARPGEFTERAFLAGKMDLVEAEAVRDLIEARTETAARLSARRLAGGISRILASAREELLDCAAELSATIDFSEDAGESLSPATVRRLCSVIASLARLESSYRTGRLLSSGCRVVLLGMPNTGKSTLFNALVGSSRAIVTDVPGTTRDTLHETLDIGGIPVELVDTAGLRPTEDSVERIGVDRARDAAGSADMVLYVFDAGLGWTAEDARALTAVESAAAVIANKIDLAGGGPGGPPGALALCGLSSEAGPRLRALLEDRLVSDLSTEASSEVLGSLRQRDLVARAREAAERALGALSAGESPEYAAAHLDAALAAIADLAGDTTAEDVLERIFSTFCIGK